MSSIYWEERTTGGKGKGIWGGGGGGGGGPCSECAMRYICIYYFGYAYSHLLPTQLGPFIAHSIRQTSLPSADVLACVWAV